MTETRQQRAIRNNIYVAGVSFTRNPLPALSVKRAESKVVASNLSLHVDRLFIKAGMPNIPQRHEFTFAWRDTDENVLEHVDRLAAIGQPFDVAIWKQVYDVFDVGTDSVLVGSDLIQMFYLQRRQAVAHNLPGGIPATSFADYATRVTLMSAPYGTPGATETEFTVVHKTTGTILTGDPEEGEAWIDDDGEQLGNRWVSRMRVNLWDGAANPPITSDVLIVAYLPLYKMVVDAETVRQFGEKLVEPRGYRFVEVG